MHQLSEQAQKLIEDFERQMGTIPADERTVVLERMTSHIYALNEDAKSLLKTLQKGESESDINNISDAL